MSRQTTTNGGVYPLATAAERLYRLRPMVVVRGTCPHCGAAIEFRAGSSVALVCRYCNTVVVRTDRDFRDAGRVADVTFSDDGLVPGDRGTFEGQGFTVEGRIVLEHPAGGLWEEYYIVFGSGDPGWIAEAQGSWYVLRPVALPAPELADLPAGHQVWLGPRGPFVVQERNVGTFATAEGELPFATEVGAKRYFVDLSGENDTWATIDYGDGRSDGAQVYIGVRTTFTSLNIVKREDYRPAHAAPASGLLCPACGSPVQLRDRNSERVSCTYCGALTDVALRTIIDRQAKSRETPSIELGTKGVLPTEDARGVKDVEWTVLAYLERSTGIRGTDEWFGWQEYLLYSAENGYRWLVFDDGKFLYVTPIAAGDVEAGRMPSFVRFKKRLFRRRNSQLASVDHVLGEVYWKVKVGETVSVTDYEQGSQVLSSESTGSEINWSHAVRVPTAVVVSAFGYKPKESPYGQERSNESPTAMYFLLFVVFLIIVSTIADCGDDERDEGSPSFRGAPSGFGYGGGFGGK